MSNGDEMSGGASEVFALVILALAFLWIAALGNDRILKVLDKRHYLLGALNKNTNSPRNGLLINGNNNNNNNNYGTTTSPGNTPNKGANGGTPRQSMGTVRSNNSSNGGAGFTGSSGGVGNGVYASTFTSSLLCDNRFVFGLFAVVLGMGEASYLMLYLFVRGSKFTKGEDIAGDNVLSDTLTAPLAWFFFSLVTAILWTLRDLLDRIKSLLNSANNNSAGDGSDLGSNGVPGSNLSTGLSSPVRQHEQQKTASSSPTPTRSNNNNKKENTQVKPIDSEETVDTAISMRTHQHENDDDDDDDVVGGEANKKTKNPKFPSESSEDELAVPVRVPLSTNSGQFDTRNTSNGRGDADGEECSFADLALSLRPYRAVISILIMFTIFVVSLIASWVLLAKDHSDAANTQATVISSIISFVLMAWSIYSSVESIVVMRKIGIAAHRVVIAIIVMAMFLLVRGVLIMPPVQSGLCDNKKDSFWTCVFLVSFVDCAGIGLILQILP